MPVSALQARETVDPLMVHPVACAPTLASQSDQPPEELLTLLHARLSALFPAVGEFKTVEAENEAGVLLTPTITKYAPASDEELGLIIELRLMLELQEGEKAKGMQASRRSLPYRTEIKAIGTGETHSAAMLRAVDEAVLEYRYRLLESPVLGTEEEQQALRVNDTLAGRVILDRGARNGLRTGDEYRTDTQAPALLKIAAVYPEFAEGHVLYGREQLPVGTRLQPVRQFGLRTALEGNYVYRMSTRQTAAEHLGGVSLRLYYDRGLFSLSPLFKIDYLTDKVAFLHTGTALNWHAGRFTLSPTLLGGVGFSAAGDTGAYTSAESQALYWGASIEMVLSWRINRNWLIALDTGASGWYCTGEEFQEARFIYAGAGFMLKY